MINLIIMELIEFEKCLNNHYFDSLISFIFMY